MIITNFFEAICGVWSTVWRLDAETTAAHARREDPSSRLADAVLLGAAIASLIAVGMVLAGAGHASGIAQYLTCRQVSR